jgi:hypothetical protein
MADMTWRPIGKIAVGDRVVALTETPTVGQNRTYELSTVQHVWITEADAIELTVGSRTLVASADHRFLATARPSWREAQRLTLQSAIVDIGYPEWLPDTDGESYLAGYVAGAVGGDGTMRIDGSGRRGTKQSYLRVAVLASDHPILDRLVKAFTALGCSEVALRPFDGGVSQAGVGTSAARDRAPMLKVETRKMENLLIVRDRALGERDDLDWKAGFLAGFLDTDGCYSGGNLRFNQTKDNGLLDATSRYITDLGFRSTREDFRSASGRSERLCGDLEDKIQFLSTIQPALERKAMDFYGRRFPSKTGSSVSGIRRVGRQTLVDIQTTAGTFIAAGLATHNCYALTLSKRLKAMGQPKYQRDGDPRTSGPGFGLALHPDALDIPRSWSSPRTIFVNSMSDLFRLY